jgi:hypothetical protein
MTVINYVVDGEEGEDSVLNRPLREALAALGLDPDDVTSPWLTSAAASALFAPLAHTHAAADVISGTLDVARIPNLSANKITSDVLAMARLATGAPDGTKFIRDDGVLAVPSGAAALDDLSDVNAPAPTDQDVLTWDDGAGEWVSQAPAGGTNALDDLSDVDTPTPADGEVLTFVSGSGNWEAVAPAGGGGGAPTTPLSGAQQLFDARSLVLSDLDPVVTWPDDSGNALDLTAAGAPTYHDEEDGDGIPWVDCDGVDDGFLRSGMTSYTGTELTLYMVARVYARTNIGLSSFTNAANNDASAADSFCLFFPGATTALNLFRNSVGREFPSHGGTAHTGMVDWSVITAKFVVVLGQAFVTLRINRQANTYHLGATTLTALAVVAVSLGARYFSGSLAQFSRSAYRAFMWYPESHSSAEVRHMESFLSSTFGVPTLL